MVISYTKGLQIMIDYKNYNQHVSSEVEKLVRDLKVRDIFGYLYYKIKSV